MQQTTERIKNILTRYPLSLMTLTAISYLSLFSAGGSSSVELFAHADKLIHFMMYAFFCSILWYEYYRSHLNTNTRKIFWGAIIAPIAFSGMLEIFQSYFTTYRTGDFLDFAFNTLGVISATFIGVFVIRPIVRSHA